MTFKELTERVHAVMDDYKINHRNDLAFLGQIAWVFELDVGFSIVPSEPAEGEPHA